MRKLKDSGVEWIGEIPADWAIGRIKYNFYLKGRIGWQGLKADEFVDNGPFLVTGTDFENGNVNWSKCYHISEERYMEAPEIHVENGDLLVTKDGTVGKVAYINNKPEKVSLNSHLLLIRPNSQLYYNKFLFWVIQSPIFDKYFSLSQNGTIMASLSQEKINNFSFPLPGMETQQCIADYLDRKCSQIDAIIARQQEVIEKLKAYKLSIITEAVTKGLNPDVPMKESGVEWIGKIPEHWQVPKIKYLATIASGGTPDRSHPEYWNGSINWAKTGELQNNELYKTEEKITELALENSSARVFSVDTILVAMYGQGKTRGMTALLKVPSATNQACAGITVYSTDITVSYLWLFLMGAYDAIREKANGSGQPNLSSALIADFNVTLPPIEEQMHICKTVAMRLPNIDHLIERKKTIIDKLTDYKKSLIYEVVTGKKEV